jgi:hypothetical protein
MMKEFVAKGIFLQIGFCDPFSGAFVTLQKETSGLGES